MKYSIIVSKGNFKTVEEAAYGEKNISWEDFSSDECRACTECFAAIDAKNVLSDTKKFDVEVYDINELPKEEGTLIFLGEKCAKFAAEKYSLEFKECTSEECYRLYAVKKDGFNIVLIYGNNRKATAYGMIEYLNYHGIRFITPEEYSTKYVKELDKSEKEEFEIIDEPSFKSRESYSEFMSDTSEDFFLWAFHNKINRLFIKTIANPEILHKLCFTTTGGGHEIWYKFMDVRHEYPYKHKIFGGDGKPDDPYAVSPLYKGDENGDAYTMQIYPDNTATFVMHKPEELPYGVRWISRTEDEDALGMVLPATAEHFGRLYCQRNNQQRYLKKGETITYHIKTGLLDAEQAQKMQAKIKKMGF
jgi:hypothetical protein